MLVSSRPAVSPRWMPSRRAWRPGLVPAAALIGLGAVDGCARRARLESVWRDPTFRGGSLRRLRVVAVGRTPRERRVFEDDLTAAPRACGVDALPSYQYVGDERVDSARVDSAMHRTKCDGVLVSRVVNRQTVERYSPPRPLGGYGYSGAYAVPGLYHGGWWPYYSLGSAFTSTPGYPVANQRVSVETNLAWQADGRLVWSELSRQWLSTSDAPGAERAPVVRELVAALARFAVVQTAGESRTAAR